MTTTDWILDIALILIVVRQMRPAPIDLRFLLIPVGIVGYVAYKNLHGLPSGGNALLLVGAAIGLGAVLGVAGGLITRVFMRVGRVHAQAGPAAAALWIGSMAARLGFIVWITHQPGMTDLAHFSAEHGITAEAWPTALVLLALSEVVIRIGIIAIRGYVRSTKRDAVPAATRSDRALTR